MGNRRTFGEFFGLVIRLIAVGIMLLGFQLFRVEFAAALASRVTTDQLWPGLIVFLCGLGALRYADVIVRFSYRGIGESALDSAE